MVGLCKKKKEKDLYPTLPFFPGSASLPTLLPLPTQVVQWDGEWDLQSVCNALSLLLLPPHTAPTWGPSQGRQFFISFFNLVPSPRLQAFNSCPSLDPSHESSLRGAACSGVVLHGVTGPTRRPALCGLHSTSCGSHQEPVPVTHCGPHLIQGMSTCCGRGSSTGCSVDICSAMVLHGLQGNNLLHHGLHHGLQGNLCSGISNISPSFNTDLGVCRVISLIFSHCSFTDAVQHFLPFPKCVVTEVPPVMPMVSALAILEPA